MELPKEKKSGAAALGGVQTDITSSGKRPIKYTHVPGGFICNVNNALALFSS